MSNDYLLYIRGLEEAPSVVEGVHHIYAENGALFFAAEDGTIIVVAPIDRVLFSCAAPEKVAT